MSHLHRKEICILKIAVSNSIGRSDGYNVRICFDSLSRFYLEDYKGYSKLLDEENSQEEKEKIHKDLTSMMNDWRRIICLQERWKLTHP
ncbi:MAG: hypothetical protein AABW47_00190 [Nanoarchaeota archaeon]